MCHYSVACNFAKMSNDLIIKRFHTDSNFIFNATITKESSISSTPRYNVAWNWQHLRDIEWQTKRFLRHPLGSTSG